MKIVYCTEYEFMNRINNKKIVLFGTSFMAEEALKRFPELCDHIECAVDNNKDKWNKEVSISNLRVKVYSPKILRDVDCTNTELLIVSRSFGEIRAELDNDHELDELNCYIYPWIKEYEKMSTDNGYIKKAWKPFLQQAGKEQTKILNALSQKVENGERPLLIPGLNVIVSSYCNLKCKDCSALIPYFHHPSHINIEVILRDINNMFSSIDGCGTAFVVGGEPFLYPDLGTVLEALIRQDKLFNIRLVTNGTVRIDPALVQILKHPKITVAVSDYGFTDKLTDTVDFLEKHEIEHEVLKDLSWITTGGPEKLGKSDEDNIGEYRVCHNTLICKTLAEGKYYGCARSARLYMLDKYRSDNDYVDISGDIAANRDNIRRIMTLDHMEACDYCTIAREEKRVVPGIQLKHGIEDNI